MTEIKVDTARIVGKISPLIYGHFWEHFHRCIYGGIYDEGARFSDSRGFRQDVVNALKKIHTPIIRWPGGNFASSYHWQDGVGPKEKRPVRFDPNWRVDEPNRFGTDEFIQCCRDIGAEPNIVVNMGDGTATEAASWVEYCNRKGQSYYASLREKNGYLAPYEVRYWGLGNEVGWPHQVGAKRNVEDYIDDVIDFARVMRTGTVYQYPGQEIRLIACGLGLFQGSRGINWDHELLMGAGNVFDYISVHDYFHGGFSGPKRSYEDVLRHLVYVEREIKGLAGQIDAAMLVLEKKEPIKIAFDEWNPLAWAIDFSRRDDNDRNEDITLVEAIYTACILNMCQRMCRSIGMANFSPTVNVKGLIYVDPDGIVLRPTYHVYSLYTNHTGELAVDMFVKSDKAGVPVIDVSGSLDTSGNRLSIAAVNKHPEESVRVRVTLVGFQPKKDGVAWQINGKTLLDYNDSSYPNRIVVESLPLDNLSIEFNYTFPAHSITVLELIKKTV